jgi:nicotinic acid mononucleotide adenylyltransferase
VGLPTALQLHWERRLTTDTARLQRTLAGSIVRVSVTPQPIEASAIRAALALGSAGRERVRGLLPASVLDYIDRNQLYRSAPDAS